MVNKCYVVEQCFLVNKLASYTLLSYNSLLISFAAVVTSIFVMIPCVLRNPMLSSIWWLSDEWHNSHHTHTLITFFPTLPELCCRSWLQWDSIALEDYWWKNSFIWIFYILYFWAKNHTEYRFLELLPKPHKPFSLLGQIESTEHKRASERLWPCSLRACLELSKASPWGHETSFKETDEAIIKSQTMNSQMKCHADSL